jgi:hypothetical protein
LLNRMPQLARCHHRFSVPCSRISVTLTGESIGSQGRHRPH